MKTIGEIAQSPAFAKRRRIALTTRLQQLQNAQRVIARECGINKGETWDAITDKIDETCVELDALFAAIEY